MLAYLNGSVQLVQPEKKYVIVVIQHVGYKVYVPSSILANLTTGTVLELYVHQVIREDANDLYGFKTPAELSMFETLLGVSGVGPKVGLAMLSELSVDAIQQALASGDRTLLTQVSGVGKKLAERLILELKGVVADLPVTNGNSATVAEALQQFGYSQSEIRQALQQIDATASMEQQLKQALALLGHA